MVTVALLAAALAYNVGSSSAQVTGSVKLATATCEQLRTTLGSIIVAPKDHNYVTLSEENWSQTAWKQPTCIALPKTTADTERIVNILVSNNVQFAIRSGGHSPNPFDANIDTGVLISTENLNTQVSYHPGADSASFGPGLRWDAVYSALDPYNVTVVGGRVMDVGVGGLTLGGGLSYLSDLYGLVCDNVLSFEVVLASGKAVVANRDQNADLFWALKGGSNNFGIVTRIEAQTYPISRVWGGLQVFSPAQGPEIMQALYEYQTSAEKDLYANCIVNIAPTNATVIVTFVYLKPVERPEAFAPFYKVTPLADYTGFSTLHELMSAFPVAPIPRWTWFTSSYAANADVYAEVANLLSETQPEVISLSKIPYGTLSAAIQPISKNVAITGKQKSGGNALGLDEVDQLWVGLDFGWDGEGYDATVYPLVESLLSRVDARAQAVGADLSYMFMNDANSKQPVIQSYGDENTGRLRAVQQAYDPDRVFQRLVAGGQKLPSE